MQTTIAYITGKDGLRHWQQQTHLHLHLLLKCCKGPPMLCDGLIEA